MERAFLRVALLRIISFARRRTTWKGKKKIFNGLGIELSATYEPSSQGPCATSTHPQKKENNN